jgi:hypothetical protein
VNSSKIKQQNESLQKQANLIVRRNASEVDDFGEVSNFFAARVKFGKNKT